MQRAGYKGSFSGVSVFQSVSLIMKGQNKTYHPVVSKKEDLEDLLRKAYGVPGNLSPMPKQVDIQVVAFEEMMSVMKDSSSNLEDDVFIPPRFEIGNDPSRRSWVTVIQPSFAVKVCDTDSHTLGMVRLVKCGVVAIESGSPCTEKDKFSGELTPYSI